MPSWESARTTARVSRASSEFGPLFDRCDRDPSPDGPGWQPRSVFLTAPVFQRRPSGRSRLLREAPQNGLPQLDRGGGTQACVGPLTGIVTGPHETGPGVVNCEPE